MEFDQNRAAKPFNVTLPDMLRGLVRAVKRWHAKRQTRLLLANLSDAQLRDIGLTRQDIDRQC